MRVLQARSRTVQGGSKDLEKRFNRCFAQFQDVAFPDRYNAPSQPLQSLNIIAIALDISPELRSPVLGVVPGNCYIAPRTSVPETALNEHRDMPAWKRNIWGPRHTPVQAISVVPGVSQETSDKHFGPGALLSVSSHCGSHQTASGARICHFPGQFGAACIK